MSCHPHLAPDVCHRALGVDQEGGALDAHERAPVERFLDPDPVPVADLAILVRSQDQFEPMFCREFIVLGDAVARNADDGCLRSRECLRLFSEA